MSENPSFESVMALTETISNHHMLCDTDCKAMYECCLEVPENGVVVEVGCAEGRSSSLIRQMAVARNFLTIHVDPYLDYPYHAQTWIYNMIDRVAYHPFILLRMKTQEAESSIKQLTPNGIDLAYIDGCHDEPVVEADMEIVATRVKPGGLRAAHDYPSGGVTEAIDRFIVRGGWTKVNQTVGFGVWRRD